MHVENWPWPAAIDHHVPVYDMGKIVPAQRGPFAELGNYCADSIKIDPAKLTAYPVDKKAPFAHPFYWSPFILIGNWK